MMHHGLPLASSLFNTEVFLCTHTHTQCVETPSRSTQGKTVWCDIYIFKKNKTGDTSKGGGSITLTVLLPGEMWRVCVYLLQPANSESHA